MSEPIYSKNQSLYIQFYNEKIKFQSKQSLRIAQLIWLNFLDIEKLRSLQGQRGRAIAKLIQDTPDSHKLTALPKSPSRKASSLKIDRLQRLNVKDFRGFMEPQEFHFGKPYTFVFGPNGSGKSSFCEAIEYSLLGTISEASAKRIPLEAYITNAESKNRSLPELYGTANGKNIQIQPDPSAFEFCLIERNRIEGFSRVSATTSAEQQSRLAGLFGLDIFNDFVKNFNEEIAKYLSTETPINAQLHARENNAQAYQQTLKNYPQEVANLELMGKTLLNKYPKFTNLGQIQKYLNGPKGLMNENLASQRSLANLSAKINPGTSLVVSLCEKGINQVRELQDMEKSLKAFKDDLSLRDLYSTIITVENVFDNKCPACESKIRQNGSLLVTVDPFQNAKSKIKNFNTAIELEIKIDRNKKAIRATKLELSELWNKIHDASKAIGFTKSRLIGQLAENARLNIQADAPNAKYFTISTISRRLLSSFEAALEEHNTKAKGAKEETTKLKQLYANLEREYNQITELLFKQKSLKENRTNALRQIRKFYTETKALRKAASEETKVVARNRAYATGYLEFLKLLNEFNLELPTRMVKDLSSKTLYFYNSINKYDQPFDRLTALKLPSKAGEKIQITFQDGKLIDALQVLSEGHIRCLGLAILLAKNAYENLPFIIFDDVVNAIDDEHRLGIVETLFNDSDLRSKQMIITTHGEEFVKQLENHFTTADHSKYVSRIDFMVSLEKKRIEVKQENARNYLVIADRKLRGNELRDALSNARRGLEAIIHKMWKRMGEKGGLFVQIKVSMGAPNRPPELMSVVLGLRDYIKKYQVRNSTKTLEKFEELLNIGHAHQVLWNYLNKGTHEEDRTEEFQSPIVSQLLEILKVLDNETTVLATRETEPVTPAASI